MDGVIGRLREVYPRWSRDASKRAAGVEHRFMEWHHLPIVDIDIPDATFEGTRHQHSAKMRFLLENGANVLLHCRGGLGRAEMIAARLLIEMGTDARTAIKQVRTARPSAIETSAQERWVMKGKPEPLTSNNNAEAIRNRAIDDGISSTL